MSFADDVEKFEANAIAVAEKDAREMILKLFTAIIKDTPVDTGRLRANWQTSAGKPKTKTLKSTNAQRAYNQAEKVLKGNPFDDIWLSNNLPYAVVIEYGLFKYTNTEKITALGYSEKSPAGMVRRNIELIWK